MRVCSVHGCPTIYPASEGSRCQAHRKQADQARRPGGSVYGTRPHRRFREAVLTRDPICVICSTAFSNIADHYPHTRNELIELGRDPNDPQSGRGLCKPCHDRHTASTSPGGWNAR